MRLVIPSMYPERSDKSILEAVARRRERSPLLKQLADERGEGYAELFDNAEVKPSNDQLIDAETESCNAATREDVEPVPSSAELEIAGASQDGSSSDDKARKQDLTNEIVAETSGSEGTIRERVDLQAGDEQIDTDQILEDSLEEEEQASQNSVYSIEEVEEDIGGLSAMIDFEAVPKSQPTRVNRKTRMSEMRSGKENVKTRKNSQISKTGANRSAESERDNKKRVSLLDSYFKGL